jgi:hypothetical protein
MGETNSQRSQRRAHKGSIVETGVSRDKFASELSIGGSAGFTLWYRIICMQRVAQVLGGATKQLKICYRYRVERPWRIGWVGYTHTNSGVDYSTKTTGWRRPAAAGGLHHGVSRCRDRRMRSLHTKQWRWLALGLNNLPAHAGAQVDAEKAIHRESKLSFVAWTTDADDTTTSLLPTTSNQPQLLSNTATVGYLYQVGKKLVILSTRRRQTDDKGEPVLFWTWDDRIPGNPCVTATSQRFKQSTIHPNYSVTMATLLPRPPSHGHCCYSATAPCHDTLLAAAAVEHSSKQQSTPATTSRRQANKQQPTPSNRPTSQLSAITRSTPTTTRPLLVAF